MERRSCSTSSRVRSTTEHMFALSKTNVKSFGSTRAGLRGGLEPSTPVRARPGRAVEVDGRPLGMVTGTGCAESATVLARESNNDGMVDGRGEPPDQVATAQPKRRTLSGGSRVHGP
jgi:hypothetical protein